MEKSSIELSKMDATFSLYHLLSKDFYHSVCFIINIIIRFWYCIPILSFSLM
jgi:hypothetical protein